MRLKTPMRLAGAAIVALLALGACASAEPKDDNDSKSSGTRTITDATGTEVTVPESPQRIVALSEQDLDSLLALDITPVGTVNGRGQKAASAYLGDKTAGIEIVGDVGKPTTDKILELEPDLVLYGAVLDEQQLEQLRELVPATVVTYKLEDDWKTAFGNIAEAVNAADKAETWLSDYSTTVEAAKGKLGEHAAATANIIRWNPDGPSILLKESFASLVIQDLGLVRPEDIEPGYAHTDPLSLENLPRVDADWLFVGTLVPGSQEALAEAKNTPAFAALEAVENERFVEVDGTLWTSRGGPLGALIVIEDVVANLGG